MMRWGKTAERGGGPSALRAVGYLVGTGLTEIRTMISAREVVGAGPDADPHSAYETEYLTRIHMITDICQGFTSPFVEADEAARERMAAEVLAHRWSVAIPEARRWIRTRLARLGPEYPGLVE